MAAWLFTSFLWFCEFVWLQKVHMQLSTLWVMWPLVAPVLLKVASSAVRHVKYMLEFFWVFFFPGMVWEPIGADVFFFLTTDSLTPAMLQSSTICLRVNCRYILHFVLSRFADEHVYFGICISVFKTVVQTDDVTVEFTSFLAHHCSGMYVIAQTVSCLSHSNSISNTHWCLVVCLFSNVKMLFFFFF